MTKSKSVAGRKHYGNGLYLQTAESGSASWLLRYQRGTKTSRKTGKIKPGEYWMGLGSRKRWNAKEARKRAHKAQQLLDDDIDPLEAKREQRRLKTLEESRAITFKTAAEKYFALHETEWTSHKHRQAFLNTLEQHAYPVIGGWPIAKVDTAAILQILEPIWNTRTQTAARVRGRVERILGWATLKKYRTGDNPAKWDTHLSEALPKPSKVAPTVHHESLPYADLPGLVQQLSQQKGIAPKALEFLVLTATRTQETIKARWNEIDDETNIWTIPAPRMKRRKEHRVPLSSRMIKLLKSLPHEGGKNSLIFVGTKANTPLDKMALPRLVESLGYGVTVHGFRSSFKTWGTEQTSYPDSMIEFALSHAVGTATEQAYQKSDMVEKRRQLMEQWSRFISTPRIATPRKSGIAGTVTPIRKAGVR